jgi:6-phospho-3-hexuloisomerase
LYINKVFKGNRGKKFVAHIIKDYEKITQRLLKNKELFKAEQIEELVEILEGIYKRKRGRRRKIYIAGAGRSLLVGKAFGMRLLHLGYQVHIVGETITPSTNKGDLLFAISGSGKTLTTRTIARKGKELGIKVIAITSHKDSPLAKLADLVVEVPGREEVEMEREYYSRQLTGEHEPLTPMGTMFELTAAIFFDAVISTLDERLKVGERKMRERHADLE